MTALHVHSGNVFGGVERMLETLAPATAGREPLLSSYALCFDGQVGERLRGAGASVHQLGPVHAHRPDQVRRARRRLRSLLDSAKWSVTVTHSAWSQAIFGPAILESGTPLVRWMHAPQPGPWWLERWASKSIPSLVLCNSQYTAAAAAPRLRNVPFVVQYPPAPAHSTAPAARAAVRAGFGTAPEKVVVALAARLERGKGHLRLLEALATLRDGDWEAWIVGGPQNPAESSFFELLRDRVAALKLASRVRFTGQRADVPVVLSGADVYCQPNESPDSFGLSFVEALSAGLPVVTTALGAAPEILDERCAILIEHGSTVALAEALRTLVGHGELRRTMSAAALRRSTAFCDLPSSLEHLALELRRAADGDLK